MKRQTPWSIPCLPPAASVATGCAAPTMHSVAVIATPKAAVTVPIAAPVMRSQLGQPWTGNDESLLERLFTSTNGGLKACYSAFGSQRTRAAIRGKLQRMMLIPKRYAPTLNPS